jgi:hypothetical protein
MILVAGAGAMAEAAKAMRKIQKNIDSRVARTRRRASSHKGDLAGAGYEPDRVDFACARLCGTCGYLVEHPDVPLDAPLDHCPACGDEGSIDLAVEPVAERVRQIEADARTTPPPWIKVGIAVGSTALAATLVALLWWGGYGGTAGLLLLASLFFVPIAYFTLPRMTSVWLLRGRTRPPHRWYEPLGLPDEDTVPNDTLDSVEARAKGDTIEAPISRRDSLAYQVCVLFDTPGDARPPEWALQEQRAVDTNLGDSVAIDAERLYLESPVELVETVGGEEATSLLDDVDADSVSDYDEVERFLRQRGLFATEGEFHIYEAVLEPGDVVEASEYDETWVLRHASAADPDELPDLPEPEGEA